jgi:hypothetical protein
VNVRPIIFSEPMVLQLLAGAKSQTRRLATSPLRRCSPGDLLYVRETFAEVAEGYLCITRADYPACVPRHFENVPAVNEVKWKPCIHMPRSRSRLTLHIEGVRTEPLQAITDADAIAEGVELESADPPFWWVPGLPTEKVYADPYCGQHETARDCFARLWSHLHGAGSWEANPNVVVLTFKPIAGNVDLLSKQWAA